jgi:F-type H+-transporting ATPase subunit O
MADPSVKKHLKAEGLAGACDRMKMNPLSKNLFITMADNGRYTHFESVINSFSTIMAAHRGEVVCEVITAKVIPFYFDDAVAIFKTPISPTAPRCRDGQRG